MLFYHFFSVAFYSIYILLTSGPPASLGEKKSGPPGWIELPGLLLFSFRVVSGHPPFSVFDFRADPIV
jgi:squalene monooxygenase